MTCWFIADTHLGHFNILRFCNRPFKTIEEHDETIINNWNSVVRPDDTVYHLGDFAFRSARDPNQYAKRLNGKKFLILGNHDKHLPDKEFTILGHYHVLKQAVFGRNSDDPPLIVLCHYPFSSWASAFHGSYHLFGHVHGRSAAYDTNSLRLDVGVDCHHFYPISYDEVKVLMKAKNWRKDERDGVFPATGDDV